jgi:predicted nucleotide-binding protein
VSHRILVVDDLPNWRQFFEDAFESIGLEVDTAQSVAEARRLLSHNEYALAVLDLVLTPDYPGHIPLDCQAFLQHLRRYCPGLPIVATTGEPLDPAEVFNLAHIGVAHFVYKPRIQLTELRQRIEQIIAGASSSRDQETARRPRPAHAFIGHGGHNQLWRELKDFLVEFSVDVETFETLPRYGRTAVDVVRVMLDRADFAFLIHTGEDETTEGKLRARQNVVHETGLFQGRLGFERAIILREDGVEEFSNLAGLQEIHFPAGNIRAVFGEVARLIRTILQIPATP